MKIAAFTMVYNDKVFLPLWVSYYGQAFGADNIFVLDHGSDDGSTENLGAAHVLLAPRDRDIDENRRAIFLHRCQAALLRHYDVVVYSDADEFLIPDPARFTGLPDFIARRCERLVNAVGLDVFHVPDAEAQMRSVAADPAQRTYVQFSSAYCKPLISRIPLLWDPGIHTCNYPPAIDSDLLLFHLKRMDKALALARLQTTRALPWSKNTLAKGHSQDHRLEDAAFVARIFPFSANTIGAAVSDGFDFSADLARYAAMGPRVNMHFFQGTVAAIPERFKGLIGGPGAAAASQGGGIAARRALARLIAVNTWRDRVRPAYERVQQWLGR